MNRAAFLKRMAFAALATWFVDLPLPKEGDPLTALANDLAKFYNKPPEVAIQELTLAIRGDMSWGDPQPVRVALESSTDGTTWITEAHGTLNGNRFIVETGRS